jgi:subtilisin family serine protease
MDFVLWASPDFVFELNLDYIPDDTLFGDQWHLRNTGQTGATVDADVDADTAWDDADISPGGSSDIVVAIVDTGVETTHPDLSIFVNEAENTGTPGVDDDLNGYIDDVNGWDFYSGDNNPNPGSTQGHGTSCAGVAAAAGDNSLGVAGAAYNCKILPVKISSDSGTFASSTNIGNAIRYAADMANVQSNSWGGGGDDSTIHSAIQYAVNTAGKPVFFASGNDADGTNYSPAWIFYTLSGFPTGTFTFTWEYTKNPAITSGDDTVWLDDITFPGGATEGFEGGTFPPTGWTTGGSASWTQYTESKHVRGTGAKSAQAGAITHNQTTYLQVVKSVTAGDLTYYGWVSSENNDEFNVDINGTDYLAYSGVPIVDYDVLYPARYDECIAVGASTDFDYRSQYSQYDETLDHVLDIVAPSNGGNAGISTTDITGSGGYDSGDYTSSFGGTSSATPLAAGCAALILSKNAGLTPSEVKDILTSTADKIGGVVYTDGYNKYYGYGRVNVDAALEAAPTPLPDRDNDTIPDINEGFPPDTGESNMYLFDSDGDGLSDGVEDADQSGAQDIGETSTRDYDSDDDGLTDGLEVLLLLTDPLNPSDPSSYTDADGDGVPASDDPNDSNVDTDGDTYRDSYELEHGSDPNNVSEKPTLGDLNDSGTVTNSDWVIGRRLTLGIFSWDDYNVNNMDVNRDGLLTNSDWVILRRYTLSLTGFDLLPY